MSPSVLKSGTFTAAPWQDAIPGEGTRRSRVAQLEEELEELKQGVAERIGAETKRVREECRREALESGELASRAMRDAAKELKAFASKSIETSEDETTRLALAIASKVIRREIARDDAFTGALVRRCLERILRRSEVQVRVNPVDHARIAAEREAIILECGLGHEMTIVADRRVERGGCIVETPDFVVDGTIRSQLAAAADAITGERG